MNRCITLFLLSLLLACNPDPPPEEVKGLMISELVSSNDGVAITEEGQTEDWLELFNNSDEPVNLSDFTIADSGSDRIPLPEVTLNPGEVYLMWADDEEAGGNHLPFKLSASGDSLTLFDKNGVEVQHLEIPSLNTNEAYAQFDPADGYQVCRYSSPGKKNTESCQPPKQSYIEDDLEFEEFDLGYWPRLTPNSLGLSELAMFPAEYIELENYGDSSVNLADYRLVIRAIGANDGLPDFNGADLIELPNVNLAPGERYAFDINEAMVASIHDQAYKEGQVSLFDNNSGEIADSVSFMHWPQEQAYLSRSLDSAGRFRFCTNATEDAPNNCEPVMSRELGDRTRGLYTPGDFAALAQGSGKANIESVKFVIDLNRDNAIHLLSARAFPLHYTFVRETIEQKPTLDRCDASENREFNNGWYQFSLENYNSSVTRRYHLGTLSKHSNAGLNNVEYTFGDAINATQMRDAFYIATAATSDPLEWTLRPQNDEQVNRARSIEGTLPIVSPKAPFKDMVFQGLTSGVAYGTLTYVEASELESASLGQKVIVVTNDVPNDIDFVGGLVTEAFQTPLAHVNLLSQSRNTPNMALPNASNHQAFSALFGKLVRLEVTPGGFGIREAGAQEANEFWDAQNQEKPVLTPRLDAQTSNLIDLLDAGFEDLPTIGAKAAQMAEMFKVGRYDGRCTEGGAFATPEGAFAIPMSFYLAHFENSGAKAELENVWNNEDFKADSGVRRAALQKVRDMIIDHDIDAQLLSTVEQWVEPRYGEERVRFRSSSNTEDLAEFNGAGLYTSLSGELNSSSRPIDVAIKTVWASLWNLRAFDERVYSNVDQDSVAMAVLVHAAFTNERANGVAVGRNVLDATRVDQFYINSQAGEASVTNPAPGIVTEQVIYQWPTRTPTLTYHSNSSLIEDPVITSSEIRELSCALDAVQEYFRDVLDPQGLDRWFTIETEFKFLGPERTLLLKQARPYKLGRLDIPNDCRENI